MTTVGVQSCCDSFRAPGWCNTISFTSSLGHGEFESRRDHSRLWPGVQESKIAWAVWVRRLASCLSCQSEQHWHVLLPCEAAWAAGGKEVLAGLMRLRGINAGLHPFPTAVGRSGKVSERLSHTLDMQLCTVNFPSTQIYDRSTAFWIDRQLDWQASRDAFLSRLVGWWSTSICFPHIQMLGIPAYRPSRCLIDSWQKLNRLAKNYNCLCLILEFSPGRKFNKNELWLLLNAPQSAIDASNSVTLTALLMEL